MKLPRTVSGQDLVQALGWVDYKATRQTGGHMRMERSTGKPHYITIPNHKPIRVGTLASILSDVATHLSLTKQELIKQIFD